jgi:O-antigen/teichoic acid export membrane protein
MSKLTIRTSKAWSDFLDMSGFKKYFTNTSWLMAEKIFRSVILLVVSVYVVRYLGSDRFGLLSYATSFVALFLPIAMLGLDGIVVRELVKDGTRRNELLGTAFFLKLTGAFFALAVLYVAIHLTSDDSFTNLLIFIIALSAVFQSFNVIDFYFQSKVLSKYVVYVNVASLTVSSCVKLFLVWTQAPLLYFAAVSLIESMILAIGLLIIYNRQKLNLFEWNLRVKLAVELLKDSWPLMLAGLFISIYMRIDQVMIKQMLDTEAVGQYAVAVKLSEAWYFIPVIVCNSLFPAVVNAKKQSEELYNARLQKLYSLMLWIAIPITVVMTLLASNIVRFLYETEFSEAGPVLAIYSWATPFVFLGVASSQHLITENYTSISFLRTLIGMVLNVLLNITLIPKYGINGAAIATVISYSVATFFIGFIPKTSKQVVLMLKSINIGNILGDGHK